MDDLKVSLEKIAFLYYDEIFMYCRRCVKCSDDAYDLTQSVFLALNERYKSINLQNIRQWLYNVAHNKIVDYYKNNKRDSDNCMDVDIYDDSSLISNFDFTENITEKELEDNKTDIFRNLTTDEKKLYEAVYVKHYDYITIAESFKVSESALRKRISRLQYKIRKLINALLTLLFNF